MTKPLVSIIIPVFNHEKYVENALRSVLKQTYRPIEIIIIDDGSNDGSLIVINKYLKQFKIDAILISRENRGAHNTINQGAYMASGDYIAILNSDDSFHPHRIEQCVETALRTKRKFIFTEVSFIDEYGKIITDDEYVLNIQKTEKNAKAYPTIGYALMKNQIAVTTGNFFLERSLFLALAGFRHYRYVHDWDFILRALFYTEPYFIRKSLYNYRLHRNNSFRSLSTLESYETSEVMRNFLWLMTSKLPENPSAPCPHYWPGFFSWFIHVWQYEVYMMPGLSW